MCGLIDYTLCERSQTHQEFDSEVRNSIRPKAHTYVQTLIKRITQSTTDFIIASPCLADQLAESDSAL